MKTFMNYLFERSVFLFQQKSFFEENIDVILIIALGLFVLLIPRLLNFLLEKIDDAAEVYSGDSSDPDFSEETSTFRKYYNKYFLIITGEKHPQIKLLIFQTIIFAAPIIILSITFPDVNDSFFSFLNHTSILAAINSNSVFVYIFALYLLSLMAVLGLYFFQSLKYPMKWRILRISVISVFAVPLAISTTINVFLFLLFIVVYIMLLILKLLWPVIVILAAIIGLSMGDNDRKN